MCSSPGRRQEDGQINESAAWRPDVLEAEGKLLVWAIWTCRLVLNSFNDRHFPLFNTTLIKIIDRWIHEEHTCRLHPHRTLKTTPCSCSFSWRSDGVSGLATVSRAKREPRDRLCRRSLLSLWLLESRRLKRARHDLTQQNLRRANRCYHAPAPFLQEQSRSLREGPLYTPTAAKKQAALMKPKDMKDRVSRKTVWGTEPGIFHKMH